MRFKSLIEDRKCVWLNTIWFWPHWIFSLDLIYYIMRSHDTDWVPYGFSEFHLINGMEIPKPKPKPRIFTSHHLSPCTDFVRYAVQNVIHHSILDYDIIYENLVPSGAENKLELFSNYVHKVMGKLLAKKCVDYAEMLLKFIHIGRLTASFYKHGTKDCAHVVPLIISGTFTKLTEDFTYGQCFKGLDDGAWAICAWFRHNDDDVLENKDFDESLYEFTNKNPKDSDAKETAENDGDKNYVSAKKDIFDNYRKCTKNMKIIYI